MNDAGNNDNSESITLSDALFEHKLTYPSIYGYYHQDLSNLTNIDKEFLNKTGFTTQGAAKRILQWKKTDGYDCIQHQFDFVSKLEVVDDDNKKHTTFVHDTSFHKLLKEQGECNLCHKNKYTNLLDLIDFDTDSSYVDTIRRGLGVGDTFKPSREFFVKTCLCKDDDNNDITENITEALFKKFLNNEIREDFVKSVNDSSYQSKYAFLEDDGSMVHREVHFRAVNDFGPRKPQADAVAGIVNRFVEKLLSDVLLWAPTRSGKSMIAAWAMNQLCGVGEIVVIVSGVTDVSIEWQETFEAHMDFASDGSGKVKSKRFSFLNAEMLKNHSGNAVREALETSDNVAIFLSQQDLAGSYRDSGMKTHHQYLFDSNGESLISYVVADECHFGAFSPSYGRAMNERVLSSETIDINETIKDSVERSEKAIGDTENIETSLSPLASNEGTTGAISGHTVSSDTSSDSEIELVDVMSDFEELSGEDEELDDKTKDDAEKVFAGLNPKRGRLFISATPFNIVSSGIFSTAKTADNIVIITPQEMVEEAERWNKENSGKDGVEEWDNPFFGMPNKLFFGITAGNPSKIFKPKGNRFADNDKAIAILDSLFSTMENVENPDIPNFFGNKHFLNTGAGRHSVFVLPQKKSCDIAEKVLLAIFAKYGVEDQHEILNISPYKRSGSKYGNKSVSEIKQAIQEFEAQGKKTIVLSVRKMLTGVTVKEWDTVVMLFKGASAQLQEQMMGRPNSPYVVKTPTADGGYYKWSKKQTSVIIHFAPETVYEFMNDLQYIMDKSVSSDNSETSNIDGETIDSDESNSGDDNSDFIDPASMFAGMFSVKGSTITSLTMKSIRDEVLNNLKNETATDLVNRHAKFDVDTDFSDKHLETLRSVSTILDGNKIQKLQSTIFGRDDNDETSGNSETNSGNETNGNNKCSIELCSNPVDEVNDTTQCEVHYMEKMSKKKAGSDDGLIDTSDIDDDIESEKKRLKEEEKQRETIEKMLKSILLSVSIYTVLSPLRESSMLEVLHTLRSGEYESIETSDSIVSSETSMRDALRIANVLDLSVDKIELLQARERIGSIDQTIHLMRMLIDGDSSDDSDALDKFSRIARFLSDIGSISSNEVFTPYWLAEKMVDILDLSDTDIIDIIDSTETNGFINLGDKEGVFHIAILNKCAGVIETSVNNGEMARDRADYLMNRLKSEKLYSVPTSAVSYEIIYKVFNDYGVSTENIIGREIFMKTGAENTENFAYNIVKLVDIISSDSLKKNIDESAVFGDKGKYMEALKTKNGKYGWIAFEEHFDSIANIEGVSDDMVWGMVKRLTEKKFDAAVGNPPYQIETTDDGNSVTNVFHEFQITAICIANSTTMIYPGGRWLQKSGKGVKDFSDNLLSSSHLKSILYFDYNKTRSEIFHGTVIKDGVSIVSYNKNHNNNGIIYLNNKEMPLPKSNIVPLNEDIISLCARFINTKNISDRKLGRGTFGIESDFVEKHPEKVLPFESDNESLKNPVKILTNNRSGSSGRVEWYWISRDDINRGKEYIDKWQVVTMSGVQGNETKFPFEVIAKEECFGRSRVAIGDFKTEEEAINYYDYLSSKFAQTLLVASAAGRLSSMGAFVPDLKDYTDSNPLFKNSHLTLDERLYKYFDLTEEEIEIIDSRKL